MMTPDEKIVLLRHVDAAARATLARECEEMETSHPGLFYVDVDAARAEMEEIESVLLGRREATPEIAAAIATWRAHLGA